MSRLRQEMQLALQGELIAKDREWCAREQAWHREKEELVKKWDDDKAEYKNLVYVSQKNNLLFHRHWRICFFTPASKILFKESFPYFRQTKFCF